MELYHYCSIDSFKKIIQNRTLRFSDVMKSNDSNEIKFLWDKYYKQMEKRATNKLALASLKYSIENQLDNTVFLTLCLSKKSDSLHMWNCYADGGINIGFDSDKLNSWAKSICMHIENLDSDVSNNASLAEVREIKYYNTDSVETYVENICKDAQFTTKGFGDIFNHAPFSKSDFFKEEAEVRIMIPIIIGCNMPNKLDYVGDNGKPISTINLETVSNSKFQNVMVCHIPIEESIINTITIGPNCLLSKADIIQILFVNGIDPHSIKITKSNGSFR